MSRRIGEKGIAFVVMMILLIVVCLGILAMSNGVSNMTRSAKNYDRSNQCYDAANAGLTMARGHLLGLAETDPLPDVSAGPTVKNLNLPNGTLGSVQFFPQIQANKTKTNQSIDKYDGKTLICTIYYYEYTLVSTAQNLPAKRALTQDVTLVRTKTYDTALVHMILWATGPSLPAAILGSRVTRTWLRFIPTGL